MPIAARAFAKVGEVALGPVPDPHPGTGEAIVREVQRCGDGIRVARIEPRDVPVEHRESGCFGTCFCGGHSLRSNADRRC
jgi:hypothetical protein